jgi:hypothetical protein
MGDSSVKKVLWVGAALFAACGGSGSYTYGGGGAEEVSVTAGGGADVGYASPAAPPVGTGASEAAPVVTTPSGGESVAVTATTTTTTTVTVQTSVVPDVEPEPIPQAMLTAASVGDVDRRDNYIDYLARHSHEANVLGIDATRRVRFRVVDGAGRPVNDAEIRVDLAGRTVLGRTHADGIWDFHPGVSAPGASGRATASIIAGQESLRAAIDVPAHGDGDEMLVRLQGRASATPQALDLGFAIDVTGSMEDELRYINREIGDIVARIRRASPETVIRVGATFYRDRTDAHVVQQIAFTSDVGGFARAMQGVRASGGGDYPEDMNAGLEHAVARMGWSQGNAARVLVLVADAPPKRYADAQYNYINAVHDATERGIRIVPVAASGADRTVEYLFRALGSITSTPYVYLTDDSGVGNPHMEADTDRIAVEYFADLITRMVVSDLRGEGMHEPGMFGPYRQ